MNYLIKKGLNSIALFKSTHVLTIIWCKHTEIRIVSKSKQLRILKKPHSLILYEL